MCEKGKCFSKTKLEQKKIKCWWKELPYGFCISIRNHLDTVLLREKEKKKTKKKTFVEKYLTDNTAEAQKFRDLI